MMMKKQEFMVLFESAVRAAKASDVPRCIDAMNRLKEAPESLICDVIVNTSVGESFILFEEHTNPKIVSEWQPLFTLWLAYLYASGREQKRVQVPVKKSVLFTTGDSKRDKVREMLQTSLSKVAEEVVGSEMKKRVGSCDAWSVAVSVESAMFENLGSFLGPQKRKYRSILFNMGDSKNPDLRRKVLIGEIDGRKLVTMENEEMGSDKIKKEVQRLKENARFREESRIKAMMMFQPSDMIMTLAQPV